ncbi:MAG: hypothetical protein R3C11_30070 [Planctomycetaceae bacterium]
MSIRDMLELLERMKRNLKSIEENRLFSTQGFNRIEPGCAHRG